MKKNNFVKEYFKDKTANQVFSFCLLVTCVIVMIVCVIARLFGVLWFAADLFLIEEPNIIIQEIIKCLLLAIEFTFAYKILCRAKWFTCIVISTCEVLFISIFAYTIERDISVFINIFEIVCYFVIPIIFNKNWFSILETLLFYATCFMYSVLFLVGRIGFIENDSAYNFMYGVLSSIDFKLFIISLYLYIKNFGGIKLWKNQKRLIFQVDQKN